MRYSVDGAGWQVGDQFAIAALEDHSNDGVHTIRYYAVDWAGNREVDEHLHRADRHDGAASGAGDGGA